MPNHTVLRELSTAVHAAIRRQVIQEVVFNDSPRGASCQDIVARIFFQIRERPGLNSQRRFLLFSDGTPGIAL